MIQSYMTAHRSINSTFPDVSYVVSNSYVEQPFSFSHIRTTTNTGHKVYDTLALTGNARFQFKDMTIRECECVAFFDPPTDFTLATFP